MLDALFGFAFGRAMTFVAAEDEILRVTLYAKAYSLNSPHLEHRYAATGFMCVGSCLIHGTPSPMIV